MAEDADWMSHPPDALASETRILWNTANTLFNPDGVNFTDPLVKIVSFVCTD
jgi:hypothetical protein